MRYIAHRGLMDGPNQRMENTPEQVCFALYCEFDVEIDLWWHEGQWMMGHEKPEHRIEHETLQRYDDKLWLHCRDVDTLSKALECKFNCFANDEDLIVVTSQGYLWSQHPKHWGSGVIAVKPELYRMQFDLSLADGICTNQPESYRKHYE